MSDCETASLTGRSERAVCLEQDVFALAVLLERVTGVVRVNLDLEVLAEH